MNRFNVLRNLHRYTLTGLLVLGSCISSMQVAKAAIVGSVIHPADISAGSGAVTPLLSTTLRSYLSITITGTGSCRIGYYGITPSATRGDLLNGASGANLAGGNRTFEYNFVPTGPVSAYCNAASSISVIEGN